MAEKGSHSSLPSAFFAIGSRVISLNWDDTGPLICRYRPRRAEGVLTTNVTLFLPQFGVSAVKPELTWPRIPPDGDLAFRGAEQVRVNIGLTADWGFADKPPSMLPHAAPDEGPALRGPDGRMSTLVWQRAGLSLPKPELACACWGS